MRVLALDPGYDRLGVAVLERVNGKETVVFSDCITSDKSKESYERLFEIGGAVKDLLAEYTPEACALETLFFSRNKTTALMVSEVRGIIMYLAQESGCEVFEYNPQSIKVATTGYGKSDKKAVTDMVHMLAEGVPKDALDDEYDAIAVGITHLATHR
ncbi:crossover junction endodeoxyribonuclease RuvC [Candidatus Kaiserbacteria bacterium]|nr:crossover junction endodeoxyribonuclease RuvC [Candidatus Kaiserbacteria bacterium]